MNFLRITGFTVVFSFVAFMGYKYITADPPGYCAAQGRYISDAEFIAKADAMFTQSMAETFERHEKWVTENPGGPFSQQYGYVNSTIESTQRWQADIEANRKRPGFAKVYRNETHTIFRWLQGYQQLTVTLNSNSNSIDSSANGYIFDICGNLKGQLGYL